MPKETADKTGAMGPVDSTAPEGGPSTGVTAEPQSNAIEKLRLALEAGAIHQDTYDVAVTGIKAKVTAAGVVAQGQDATASGPRGVVVAGSSDGDINTGQQLSAAEGAQIVYAEQGATVVIGDAPVAMTAVDRQSRLGRYLQHLISQNR